MTCMRGRFRLAAALLLAALAFGSVAPLAAADNAAPRFFVLHQEMARPSMLQQYESTTKEFVSLVHQNHSVFPSFGFTAVAGDDYLYTFISPIASFADIDGVFAGFGKLAQAVGEAKWGDLMKRGGQATELIRESVVMEDPTFSYAPAQPRLKPEEERYLHVDLYYIQPGREADADAVAKEFVALFRKKGVPDGYRLFKVAMGPEMPLILVTIPAKDEADYAARNQADLAMLGAEGQALFARAFALTRRFERHGGTIRPDLSLAPAVMTK